MKRTILYTGILVCLVLALAMPSLAQPQGGTRGGAGGPGRGGMFGDWLLKSDFNGQTIEWLLTFDRDAEGNLTAQMIGFMGVSDLKDVKFENGQLSFTQTREGRDGQTMTSTFKGTVAEGKLTGTLTSDRGDLQMTGERAPRPPRGVGSYLMKMTRGEREFTPTLIITADKEGTLKGQWKSERGQLDLSDLQVNRGALTFTLKSTDPQRQFEMKFEGTLRGNEITGKFTSERGETEATGTRIGAEAIGTWNLVATGERGERKQRLQINPDMSGLYGTMAIEKVDFTDGQLSFKITRTFGDRQFEMNFTGKIQENKLTGEMNTSMGSQKITGEKVVRGRRPAR